MKIHILNTVCLPIRTGPAMAGAIRAKYWDDLGYEVVLFYPYLHLSLDQQNIYQCQYTQSEYIQYLREAYSIPDTIQVVLYKTEYNYLVCYQVTNIDDFTNEYKNDILFIEDPEPLNMSHPLIPHKLCINYKYVVFICHTQYLNIAKLSMNHPLATVGLDFMGTYVWGSTIIHPNLFSISISKAIYTQYDIRFNKSNHIVSGQIHGVNDKFFAIARDKTINTNQIYYIGKLERVHKCLDYMLDCAKRAKIKINVFGAGKDSDFIQSNADNFIYKGIVLSPEQLDEYSIYVSFSDLEGLCTATAEAIVMNKICVIRKCECNDVFANFDNVFFFNNEIEFKAIIEYVRTIQYIIPGDVSAFSWTNCNTELRRLCHNTFYIL